VRGSKEGIVLSKKMKKTAVVQVERVVRHPLYQKVLKIHKNYHVHDPKDECRPGQKVLIAETSPVSATKKHKLVKILEDSGEKR
jgi:small subunit ribosomal protein S17